MYGVGRRAGGRHGEFSSSFPDRGYRDPCERRACRPTKNRGECRCSGPTLSVPAGSCVLAQGAGSQPAAVMVSSTSDERVWRSVRSGADEYPGSPHLPVVWGRSAGYIHVRDAACPSVVARAMWGMLRWRGGGGQSRSPMRLAAAVSCRGRDRSCRGLPQRRYTRGGCSYVVAASSACRLVPCCRRSERSAAVSAALVIGMTRTSPLPWPPPRAHVRRPCHGAGRALTRIGHGRYGTSSGCRAAVAIGTTRTLSPRPSPRGVPFVAVWRPMAHAAGVAQRGRSE